MVGLRPIPRRLLADSMVVRVPDGDGGFDEGVAVGRVRFQRVQRASDDMHRAADAGGGVVFVDAVNSVGAFEVPVGSRVDIDGVSLFVAECRRCVTAGGRVHHWELTVR